MSSRSLRTLGTNDRDDIDEHKSHKIIRVRIDEVQQGGIVKGNDITGEGNKGADDY